MRDKWYVVDLQQICILDGAPDFAGAQAKADARIRSGNLPAKSLKVMTHPRVGTVTLDPKSEASWSPKRSTNPAQCTCPKDQGRVTHFSATCPLHKSEADPELLYARAAKLLRMTVQHVKTIPLGELKEMVVDAGDEILAQRLTKLKARQRQQNVHNPVPRRNPDAPAIGSLWMLRAPTSAARRHRVYEVTDVYKSLVEYKDSVNGELATCPLNEWYNLMSQSPERNPRRKPTQIVQQTFASEMQLPRNVNANQRATKEVRVWRGARTSDVNDYWWFGPKNGDTRLGGWSWMTDGHGAPSALSPNDELWLANTMPLKNEFEWQHSGVPLKVTRAIEKATGMRCANIDGPFWSDEPLDNPGELLVVNDGARLDSTRAEKVFEMWHKKPAKNAKVVRPRVNDNDEMVCVGHAHDIVYRSGKWEAGKKTNDYIHTFDSRPKVWMLASCVPEGEIRSNASKTVGDLLKGSRNKDGQFACADLATPISLSIDSEDNQLRISSGARVLGAVDKKTVIILDPKLKLVVIRGGSMYFDERGIVK